MDEMDNESFGAWLKERRKAAGWSQGALGARLGITGVNICKAEKGQTMLGHAALVSIAKVLGVPREEMLVRAWREARPGSLNRAMVPLLEELLRLRVRLQVEEEISQSSGAPSR